MRRLCVVATLGLCFFCQAQLARAQEKSPPYDAYVAVKVALARSGPGMDHYPTDPLPRGERVQVVNHQDQWLAIEAPQDSFSWVPGEHLLLSDDGTSAEVISDHVQSWIGSNVQEIKDHEFQIQLRKGEHVEVLDQKKIPLNAERGTTWVKIKPPVGELRWVNARDLSETAPPEARASSTSHPKDGAKTSAEKVDLDEGWTERGRRPIHRPSDNRDEVNSRSDASSARTSHAQSELKALLDAPADSSFDDHFARLQTALSRVAAKGASVEDFDLLQKRADALAKSGKSSYERGQATLLAESIEEFRQLAERREQQVSLTSFAKSDSASSGKDLLPADETTKDNESDEDEQRSANETTYLAQGRLMPVSSPGKSAPPFVLMDEEGHPVAFVTPAPGFNLRSHIDQEVGIIGQQSFPVFEQKHVIAHRVVELDRHRGDRSNVPWIRYRTAEK